MTSPQSPSPAPPTAHAALLQVRQAISAIWRDPKARAARGKELASLRDREITLHLAAVDEAWARHKTTARRLIYTAKPDEDHHA